MNFNYLQEECDKLAIFLEEIQQEFVQIKPDVNVTINQFLETEVSLNKILHLKQISPTGNNNMFNKKHKEGRNS